MRHPFAVLSPEDIDRFASNAERLLERSGFAVQDAALLKTARSAGAHVEEASGRVRLPRPLLRELLGCAPRRYAIGNVAGGTLEIGGPEQGVFGITNDPWILDYATQRPRRPRLDDVRTHTILGQRLDPVVCMSCMDFPVAEYDDATSSWRALEVHLLHHAKHCIVMPASPERFREWLRLGEVLAGGSGLTESRLITCAVPVVSPLTLTRPNVELLRLACDHDCPILPTVCPMAGTTAPYTRAATLLEAHAENLMLAAMTQLLRPGHPFLHAIGPSTSDLRTAQDRYYTLDKALWKVAGVQLAHAAGLPCMAECGGTMPARYDMQAGAESFLFMLAACGSATDILSGIGSCYNANGLSAEMIVIQSAWLDAARHLTAGIPADEQRLGIESLEAAGPGGNFLTDALTLEFMHGGEFFEHPLFDYTGDASGVPMLDRAHARVRELVEGFESPVPGRMREALERYFRDYFAK